MNNVKVKLNFDSTTTSTMFLHHPYITFKLRPIERDEIKLGQRVFFKNGFNGEFIQVEITNLLRGFYTNEYEYSIETTNVNDPTKKNWHSLNVLKLYGYVEDKPESKSIKLQLIR